MNRIMHYAGYLGRYLRGTRAIAAMEYAILVGVLIVVVAAGVATFSGQIQNLFNRAENAIKNAAT